MKNEILKNNGIIRLNTQVEGFNLKESTIKNIYTNNGSIDIEDKDIVISCLPSIILGDFSKVI